MQFNNRKFGAATMPFKHSPFIANYERYGNPYPPTQCLLGIQATSGVLALQVGGFLSVHCPVEVYNLVNYRGDGYTDYEGSTYIELQP